MKLEQNRKDSVFFSKMLSSTKETTNNDSKREEKAKKNEGEREDTEGITIRFDADFAANEADLQRTLQDKFQNLSLKNNKL